MAKSIIAGDTDYSHQSFNDILEDLNRGEKFAKEMTEKIEFKIKKLEDSGYWEIQPYNFKSIIYYSLKHYKTTQEELVNIHNDIQITVQENHCKRLERIANVGQKINIDIGRYWHRDFDDYKDYDNPQFHTLEYIYNDTRDMAVNLLDYSNIANRLNDFIGKTNREMNNNPPSKETINNSGNLIINNGSKINNQNNGNRPEQKDSIWSKAQVIIALVVGIATVIGIIWQMYK